MPKDWTRTGTQWRLGLPITTGGLPKRGYPDASFAAVTMSHSIEHLDDPVAGLREIRRILQRRNTKRPEALS